ncbi:phosphoenolpyruvate carboxykinase (ATP) [Pollutibacter soli]|uniref:phosphoenolpyruvate carboxykinase (ATP) n=1 Tax=Pollutibacter soli TaxID=3034157 RepID=UPI003013B3ED
MTITANPLIPREKILHFGLRNSDRIHYQLSPQELAAAAVLRGEAVYNDTGALVINTGECTGRSPKDKYIVLDELTRDNVDWNNFNQPIDSISFDRVFEEITEYLATKDMWVRDCYACADDRFRVNIRVITEKPAENLFAYNMFLRPSEETLETFRPNWQIISASGLKLDPRFCGTRSGNAAIISFKHRMILIAGTAYTGEIKKGIFTVLNYILPLEKDVLSMHCSANKDNDGNTALFFGLSGTGKTTLSADPRRMLIGDDEHGWTAEGVFNFEGGCYAKCIQLSEEKEPQIFHAVKPGALVENTRFFEGTNTINFDDGSITENTRVSYPLDFIDNAASPSVGNNPKHIFFLTCDAYGILPPVSQLTPEQAMYQFISGYTAKVAGTEAGVTEPKATFSACFGAPFLPLHPGHYAQMLGRKLKEHNAKVWLINTGWTGGPYGTGSRIKLAYTRALITAVLEDKLNMDESEIFPVFNFRIPKYCEGVPDQILNPANTWSDKNNFTEKSKSLAKLFTENFQKYADGVSSEIKAAAPARI